MTDERRAAAASWLEAGRAAWPGVAVPPNVEQFIAERIPDHVPAAQLPIADLYLACACAAGDRDAIAIVERDLLPAIVPAIRQVGADDALVDEVLQIMRASLLVADRGPAKIENYSGRGPLRSWLRAVAVKTAISALRVRGSNQVSDDSRLARLADPDDDPELRALKTEYRVAFKQAFQVALAALTPRAQMLIKQHHLDGLTIDRLGALYGVDRATAARWLVAARTTLYRRTRKELVQALGLTGDELASVVRLVKSQIELSLHRLLPRGDDS
jgi:RNA polymerase sigma-70 factor, ECF subfamily